MSAQAEESEDEGASRRLSLDLENRTIVQPVDTAMATLAAARFVEIDIAEIINPRLIRIIFEVAYRPPTGADVPLGSFSPFPPDNPGTYIVSTRDVVGPDGAIILSMVVLDEVRPQDEVRVSVDAISVRQR